MHNNLRKERNMGGRFRKVVRGSCEGSSMKALPKLVRARTCFQRLFWLLALFVGLAVASYQLMGIVRSYLNYDTSVNMSPVQEAPPFPDVTVCKMDAEWPFKQLEHKLREEDLFEAYRQKLDEWVRADGNVTPAMHATLSAHLGYFQNIPEIYDNLDYLRDLFIVDCGENVDWEFGSCFVSGKSTVTSKTFMDPYYGLCTTFQVWNNNLKGLSLLLYLDDFGTGLKNYQFNPTERLKSKGARVVIHPHRSFPDIHLATYHAHPGIQSVLKLNSAKHTVLPLPYGSCIQNPDALDDSENATDAPSTRHLYECYRLCGKHYIIKQCGCLDFYYPTTPAERAKFPMCGFIEPTNRTITLERMRCAAEKILDLDDPDQMYSVCECPTYCEKMDNEYTVEEQPWPTETFHLSFYDQKIRNASFGNKFQIYEKLLDISYRNETEALKLVSETDLIRRNFLEVHIFNHQRNYFHYTETPLISSEALFGNIGGILNLWVGITFITIIEIIDFLHQLVVTRDDDRDKDKCDEQSSSPPHVKHRNRLLC